MATMVCAEIRLLNSGAVFWADFEADFRVDFELQCRIDFKADFNLFCFALGFVDYFLVI